MQMWVTDGPCVPKTSWGSLDQEDTGCLIQGVPDHEDQEVGPLKSSFAETLFLYHSDTYLIVVMANHLLFTPQMLIF